MEANSSKARRKLVILGGWQQHVDLERVSDRLDSEVSSLEKLDHSTGYLSVNSIISSSPSIFFLSYGGWTSDALWVARFPEISAVFIMNPIYSSDLHAMFHMTDSSVIIFYSASMEMVRRDSQKIHDYTPNSQMIKVSCDDPGLRNLSCENILSTLRRKIDEFS